MREFIVENLINTENISVTVVLLNNIVSMVVAFFLMFTYKITYSGTAYSKKFNVSLGAITLITTMIMGVISNNIALSLGMVGALSIIRFRTAVKDVRDAAFIFWAIAVGIGCGVSQYMLIGMGSGFLLLFFMLTRNMVSAGNHLLIVQGSIAVQSEIEAAVEKYFEGKAHLSMKNGSKAGCEFIYDISDSTLRKANEKNMTDIAERLLKLDGIERVNLIEQKDDIAR